MSKRRIILFASVLIVALIVLIVVFFVRRGNTTPVNPFKIIPSDAVLIVQANSFHKLDDKLFNNNEVFKSLDEVGSFKNLAKDIHAIDSVGGKISEFGEVLYNNPIYISAHIQAEKEVAFLFLIQLNKEKDLKDILKIAEKITSQHVKKTEQKFEGTAIYNFSLSGKDGKVSYFLAEVEGNILLSRSRKLIEASVRQYSEQASLLTNKQFLSLISTASKAMDGNVYVNMQRFPKLISSLCNDTYHPLFRDYKNFGSWMLLKINAKSDQILLNGIISTTPSGQDFIDVFKGNHPAEISVDSLLPASTTAFLSFGAKNLSLLNDKYIAYLEHKKGSKSNRKKLYTIESSYGIKFANSLLPLLEGEITLAKGNFSGSEDGEPGTLILLKCKSGVHTYDQFAELLFKYHRKKGGSPDLLESEIFVAPDTYPVVRVPIENLTSLLFGDLFAIQGSAYMTHWRNYVILAGSKDDLRAFLFDKVRKKTLSTNEAYSSFKSSISDSSYILFYGNLTKSAGIFKEYLDRDLIAEWEKHGGEFQKIQPYGFQITRLGNMAYVNILMNYTGVVEGKPRTVWESQLENTFSFKPQLVQKAGSQENEIFLQDDKNTIYLINKAGVVLWKQMIPEAINSKVEQIDYFGNGKLQYLFSTASKIYLIDRNGNRVEPFPVTLRSKATAGMALFDYEGDGNYRIFVPCKDNQVYVYDKSGKIVSGWDFKGSENRMTKSPEHFRNGDKDYIVISDQYRVYILDRRGGERVNVKRLINHSKNNTYYLNLSRTPEKSTIVTTDTSGQVIQISFNGEVKEVSVGHFSSEHFFDFKDVDADGRNDYIFVDHNKLSVFRQDKSKIFEYEFPNDITMEPIYFEFSRNDRKLGIVDQIARKIYLINKDGSLYKGFPLEGSTLFSIGFLDIPATHFNLIVGGRNNFLYNYSVQ